MFPPGFTKQQHCPSRPGFPWSCLVVAISVCLIAQSTADAQRLGARAKSGGENEAVAAQQSAGDVVAAVARGIHKYEESIKPILRQACFDCHSGDDVEGNFRADQLDPDLVSGGDTAWWLEVYSVLSKGEMPPPESSGLTDDQRTRFVDWLSSEIQAAEKFRKANGNHSSFRRLTRYEFNYALQDLLGVPWDFANDLPGEASEEDAFENNAESLHMSVRQVETYHRLALRALRRVTVRGERPPVVHWSIPMERAFDREKKWHDQEIESTKKKLKDKPGELAKELERLKKQFQAQANRSHYLERSTGMRAKVEWQYRKAKYAFEPNDTFTPMPASHFAVVQPGRRQDLTIELGDRLPDNGTMRVRVRASRADGVKQRIPSLQLHYGFQATDQGRSIKRISQHDISVEASFGEPGVYQWDIPLGEIEHRNTYRGEMKLGQQPNPSEYIRFTNSTVESGEEKPENPAILIDYVEVAALVYDEWPPQSHRKLFVESDSSRDETAYAKEIVANFMSRAWRRQPNSRDLDRKLQLFKKLRPGSSDFSEAILEVLATILASPKFLYVLPGEGEVQQEENQHQLSQHELATRLSLFLWCSLPDATLFRLAAEGRLGDKEVLEEQVERMLADPRAARFGKHFVVQWLKMQPLEYLRPTGGDDGLDEALLESMKLEPVALFVDMLRRDSSIPGFIESDYLVVNERLAKHYGVSGVQGNYFRRVPAAIELNRGGLLTQSGLLTLNSDGKDSHPVKRGVWLLTNLLNDPPPAPPPAVPEIDLTDPEIAKLTLKERIEDHRNHAACRSCHQKIDPWGIAFENYDALGRWRDEIDGKVVDATSDLPGDFSLNGMSGLKEHLLQNRHEQFRRAVVEKMASFALGRQLHFGDRAEVTDITKRLRESGDGLKTLVTCLVTSELFQSK